MNEEELEAQARSVMIDMAERGSAFIHSEMLSYLLYYIEESTDLGPVYIEDAAGSSDFVRVFWGERNIR